MSAALERGACSTDHAHNKRAKHKFHYSLFRINLLLPPAGSRISAQSRHTHIVRGAQRASIRTKIHYFIYLFLFVKTNWKIITNRYQYCVHFVWILRIESHWVRDRQCHFDAVTAVVGAFHSQLSVDMVYAPALTSTKYQMIRKARKSTNCDSNRFRPRQGK